MNKSGFSFLFALLAAIFALQLGLAGSVSAQSAGFLPKGEFPKTDFEQISVDLDEIMSGGPPKDGIPAIDSPTFVTPATAQSWLGEDEPVVSLAINGEARAYPLQILIYHEIVNDTLAATPVSVTFCPLCNASIVFDRRQDDAVLDFGTTGRLRNSDMIMYDRQSESWWQQFTGLGIIGKYNEVRLSQIPSQIVSFATFRAAYPQGEILSRETGYSRPYGNNPYSGYDHIDNSPFLYNGPEDPRLRPMERVLSVPTPEAAEGSMLFPFSTLKEQPLINVTIDERALVIVATTSAQSALDHNQIASSRRVPAAAAFHAQIGDTHLDFKLDQERLIDEQTGSEWDALGRAISGPMKGKQLKQIDNGVHFAFALLAFDPNARIFTF